MRLTFKISIDKDSDTPVYRQIIEQITSAVKKGKLKAGAKLPPERELAKILDTARGTVNKAYENLARNNIIEIIRGRGSFISREQDIIGKGRKEKAVKIIEQSITKLEKLNFSYREISSLIHIILLEREKILESINIAAIDCNPEALVIFEQQLLHVTPIQLTKLLLDEISKDPAIKQKLSQYDLILTTSTHYSELIGLVPELKDKIIQAAVSPNQQTIIDLAAISSSVPLGIICRSRRFLQIIKDKLKEFQINSENVFNTFEEEEDQIIALIKKCKVLIIPPDSPILNDKEYQNLLWSFREKGGEIIKFEYQIERGTLIYIEEKISNILNSQS